MSREETPRWATKAEAAEYARCSTRTLERRIASGEITGYNVGSRVVVDLNEIDANLFRPILTAEARS